MLSCTWRTARGEGVQLPASQEDEKDSADLADLLRMGRLPEAWAAPHAVRELRELTRYRHKLMALRTSCKDQVHAVLAKLGIPVTCSDLFGKAGSAWQGHLAAAADRRAHH